MTKSSGGEYGVSKVSQCLSLVIVYLETGVGLVLKKSEICISGMATSSRHSLPTQPKRREEKTAWLLSVSK
jgi:hypothetical protein